MRDRSYIVIQGWMLNKLKLKSTELIIFAIIFGFSQDEESYFDGSLSYLCKCTNATKPTVIAALKRLHEEGLILKISEVRNRITLNKYQVNFDLVENILDSKVFDADQSNNLMLSGKEIETGGSKESLHNNTSKDNTILKTKDKEAKAVNFTSEQFADKLIELGADPQEVSDFMKVRKKKKAADTLTALNGFINECNRHNFEIKEAVRICVVHSWKGFQYDWLKEDEKKPKEDKKVTLNF